MKIFIGGSRKITHLSPEVQQRLDRIIKKGHPVLDGRLSNGMGKNWQWLIHV
jgi:hypothetical protein